MAEQKKVHGNGKINPEVRNKIINAILRNVPYEKAADAGRITEKTLYNWINRGIEDQEKGIDSEYVLFLQDLKETEYLKMAAHLDAIEAQTERWQARAWLLERRWRQHFGQDAGVIQELLEKQTKLEDLLQRYIEGAQNGNA